MTEFLDATIVDNINKFLEEHGIDLLTGEADGTSLRGLYDLNDQGQEILGEFLGGATFTASGWNNHNGKSAMLAWTLARPLAIYILLREGYSHVVDVQCRGAGYYSDHLRAYKDITWAAFNQEMDHIRRVFPDGVRFYYKSGTAKDGLRHRHEFSDRVE